MIQNAIKVEVENNIARLFLILKEWKRPHLSTLFLKLLEMLVCIIHLQINTNQNGCYTCTNFLIMNYV